MTDAEIVAAGYEIQRAVLSHFIETGNPAFRSDIARILGWSASKTRAVLTGNFGAVPGTQHAREIAPGSTSTARSDCWVPSRSLLRDTILGERKARGTP